MTNDQKRYIIDNKIKYKLIQEYPGSPKINTIIWGKQHPDYGNCILWQSKDLLYYGLNTSDIINYPKFWKQIK